MKHLARYMQSGFFAEVSASRRQANSDIKASFFVKWRHATHIETSSGIEYIWLKWSYVENAYEGEYTEFILHNKCLVTSS